MTDRKTLTIKNTWSYVIAQPELAGELFYEKLFELDPTLRGMFPPDLGHQAQKLTDMITYMVRRMQAMPDIQKEIDALAVRHAGYGVHDAHYITVGGALLSTLEKLLEEHWDEECCQAWTELYNIWASSMIKASHEARNNSL
ncbi:globin domain-containing protein [Dyadobacter chenwenxiniae]|uniref:Globin domain-containing protein n=1 Tax=Dyadobacter chenwenxiniae TaxID=2906456 RepID=A0A9X1TPU5_9BACT|nr:globin domain-containing protein [Dyadobacter chenwenxiniae]MCF0065848.1 globin domain-containing protein [Dyadobacter chenwenxiniae]UON84094.1 globin domain-containing protein [Dyadobacter chenwenxiniae]